MKVIQSSICSHLLARQEKNLGICKALNSGTDCSTTRSLTQTRQLGMKPSSSDARKTRFMPMANSFLSRLKSVFLSEGPLPTMKQRSPLWLSFRAASLRRDSRRQG